jgi:sulfopyruvate decarboxylase subunit beta
MEVKLLRYDLMKNILQNSENSPIISNLGPTSDELWHLTKELEIHPRERNFYTYGSMGLCSSIALGISINTTEKVISIDGDGSLLMNLGTLSTIGRISPGNLIIVVCDNEMWAQTGYQPTATAFNTDLEKVAKSCGFKNTFKCTNINEFKNTFSKSLNLNGPTMIVAKTKETGEFPEVTPVEPEFTVYRFRNSMMNNNEAKL